MLKLALTMRALEYVPLGEHIGDADRSQEHRNSSQGEDAHADVARAASKLLVHRAHDLIAKLTRREQIEKYQGSSGAKAGHEYLGTLSVMVSDLLFVQQ